MHMAEKKMDIQVTLFQKKKYTANPENFWRFLETVTILNIGKFIRVDTHCVKHKIPYTSNIRWVLHFFLIMHSFYQCILQNNKHA